jgi:hypothetical protein
MGTEKDLRPWWVRASIPYAGAKRWHVILQICIFGPLMTLWLASMVALAFVAETGQLHAFRFLVLAFFALMVGHFALQVLAVRWTDRAKLWQR